MVCSSSPWAGALKDHPWIVNYQSNQQKNETNVKLINPSAISARILTLLDESDERVIIVSPYMKISKWYKQENREKRMALASGKYTAYQHWQE